MNIKFALGLAILILVAAVPASAALPVRYIALGDTSLAYIERGRGDPIVLVHGGLQDYRVWESHMATLARHHRVIAYSRRNHFPNPAAVNGWPDTSADLHANDLYRLVTALHLGPVHLVAHSSGAFAALFFAAQHPELVRSLAVNEPPAASMLAGIANGPEIIAVFNARLAPSRTAFKAGDLALGVRLFTDAVSGPGVFETRGPAIRAMLMDNAIAHQADAVSLRPRPIFTCEMARRITAPTLISNGDRSPPFFHAITDQLARCIPHNSRASFRASHGVPLESRAAYDRAVLKLITSA
jgi:non-heme chloroperoxidase